MAEQRIIINIATRNYEMYISPEQEEIMRRIGKNIENTIREMEKNYATKDKQDALAMTALKLITEAEFALIKLQKNIDRSHEKVKEITSLLEELEKEEETQKR